MHPRESHRRIRVLRQPIPLMFQFFRQPDIVGVEEGDKLAARDLQPAVPGGARPVDIRSLRSKHSDPRRIA